MPAAGAVVVGDNGDDGRGNDGGGSSNGSYVDSGGGGSVDGGSVHDGISDDGGGDGGNGCGGGGSNSDSDDGGNDGGGKKATINQRRECQRWVVDMSMTAGDDKHQKCVADDEGSNKEGGKGSGNGERVAGEQWQQW